MLNVFLVASTYSEPKYGNRCLWRNVRQNEVILAQHAQNISLEYGIDYRNNLNK